MDQHFQHIALRIFDGLDHKSRVLPFTCFSDFQREQLRQVEEDGWEQISATVLYDGSLVMFFKRSMPSRFLAEPDLPEDGPGFQIGFAPPQTRKKPR